MERGDACYRQYVQIMREELRPAMGCTEPIAIAYAAAKARAVLGAVPERLLIEVSGNIIKNVKSVVVPHTGGLRGIPAAAAAGVVAGDADAELEVLSHVTEEGIRATDEYLETVPIEVKHADTGHIFDIMITVFHGEDSAFVRIVDYHTNVVCIRRNGETLLEREISDQQDEGLTDRSCLTIEGIVAFAECVDLEDVREILERQIAYNMAIAEEGLRNDYGANIGKTVLRGREYDINYKMRAWAAAASDARMSGCELPVVINSGSGNQGITASVPVIVYARETGKTREELLRALCVSNLVTTHLKTGIGRLSAYCGAVSAGCGAGAGIAYLRGGRFDMIAHTVVNAVAMDSGIICDGAKASCAAKIANAVDAGLLGIAMYEDGNQFFGGDGIVKKGVENTIASVGRLARFGMEQTDKEIIQLMREN
jgi:L-cysteine desulfidase